MPARIRRDVSPGHQRPGLARRWCALVVLAVLVVGAGGCRNSRAEHRGDRTVILVSLDGFAARFLNLGETPTLARLAREGVSAPGGMVPVFPTKTFPNHYTIVTGLYPEHHGIVANTMYDPVFDSWFRLSDREAVRSARWWGGEPLWVTAEKQGQKAAPFFWPGSEAAIEGVRPSYWTPYDGSVPNPERVRGVLAWLDLPPEQRPSFITLYFDDVDGAAHRSGTVAPDTRAALRRVDAAVAELVAGLEERGLFDRVNLVMLADHGLADRSPDSVIFLDDYLTLSTVRVSDWTPLAAIWPRAADEDAVYQALSRGSPHWKVYRKADMPARFHYRDNRRIAPILALADEGWSITQHGGFNPSRYAGADHGYDNELLSMRALFVAHGPAFRVGATVPPFGAVHVYELLCAVLGLDPAPNDGDLDSVKEMLRD